MHFAIMRVIVLHLIALTLAAPTVNVNRDWMDKFGHLTGADQGQPYDYNTDDENGGVFGPDSYDEPPKRRDIMGKTRDLAGATSPSRRGSPPDSQDGVVSKLGKRDILDMVARLLGIAFDTQSWSSSIMGWTQRSLTILDAIDMQDDPLMKYLHDGSNAFGQGLAVAKANLLEKILVPASKKYNAKNAVVQLRLGPHSNYSPHNLLDLMEMPQGDNFRLMDDIICPDGTTYQGEFVTASWELANLPDITPGFPLLFSNEHNSDHSKGKVFDVKGDLLHGPMVDDYLLTGKMGQYSIVIDKSGKFLGVVQDDGSAGYTVCKRDG